MNKQHQKQQQQHKVHNEIIPEDYQSELNHINDENIEMIAAKSSMATAAGRAAFRQQTQTPKSFLTSSNRSIILNDELSSK